jgi:hypothetical protein
MYPACEIVNITKLCAESNMPKSWKPEVFVEGKWSANSLRFATEKEAADNARDLLMRWFVPTDSRAAPSDDPVNYDYTTGVLKAVEQKSAT